MNPRQRAIALLAGSAAVVSSLAAAVAPAAAVPISPLAIPKCNASQSDTTANAALAAYNRTVSPALRIKQFRGSAVPNAVYDSTRKKSARWGTYYTRIYVRNGAVLKGYICKYVNEAGIPLADQRTSMSLYHPVVFPALPNAANRGTSGTSMKKAAILSRVKTEIVTNLYGQAAPLGAGSMATYSVQGFYNSLQAALVKAKL